MMMRDVKFYNKITIDKNLYLPQNYNKKFKFKHLFAS